MDQAELYGRVIKVNQAKPQKQAGEKLGSKTAVWEQVRFLLLFYFHGNVACWKDTNKLSRKIMRQSTMSAKRTRWRSRRMQRLQTRCRDWRD